MLVNFLVPRKSISFYGCVVQMFFFACFGDAEFFILAAMAYDCYTAICNPLVYSTLMSWRVCISIVVLGYLAESMTLLLHVSFTFRLLYCALNVITFYVISHLSLLYHVQIPTSMSFCSLSCVAQFRLHFMVIVISYTCILITVLSIKFSGGRSRTFSTCASHLMAVTLFYGILLMYLCPTTTYSPEIDKVVSLFYTVLFPRLNPMIYSFRNKDVKNAIQKLFERRWILKWIRI